MKILGRRIAGSARSRLALVCLGLGAGWAAGPLGASEPASARQQPPAAARAGNAREDRPLPAWTAQHANPQQFVSQGEMWADVISSTPRWIVVQNRETGQQFPIAGDRIRQFLVRWPASVGDLSQTSMVEATGFYNNGAVAVDHIDIYEADAKNLVTPTMQTIQGTGPAPMTFDSFTQSNFGIINYQEVGAAAMNPGILHVVGQAASANPLTLSVPGANTVGVVPGDQGMSVMQVTLGTNSYAKKGDMVHIIPEAALPRSLDVSQLILYKKIPLRQFQP